MTDLAVVRNTPGDEQVHEAPEWARIDEPVFPTQEHQDYYRGLVRKMLAEAQVHPALFTATKLSIERIARDHVTGIMADQGETKAISRERDRRMLANLKLLSTNVQKADDTATVSTRFILGFVEEIAALADSRLGHDQVLAGKFKDELQTLALDYTRRALTTGRDR